MQFAEPMQNHRRQNLEKKPTPGNLFRENSSRKKYSENKNLELQNIPEKPNFLIIALPKL
jgi:hypothetical protein